MTGPPRTRLIRRTTAAQPRDARHRLSQGCDQKSSVFHRSCTTFLTFTTYLNYERHAFLLNPATVRHGEMLAKAVKVVQVIHVPYRLRLTARNLGEGRGARLVRLFPATGGEEALTS